MNDHERAVWRKVERDIRNEFISKLLWSLIPLLALGLALWAVMK